MKISKGSLALPARLLSVSLVTAVLGCSGNSMLPKTSNSFTVNSVPEGATVYVLGKAVGETPLTLEQRNVFPTVYPPELQNLYGKVELRHEGCETLQRPVSGHVLANGLRARLKCEKMAQTSGEQAGGSLGVGTASTKSIKLRLRELQALKEEGLVSEEEYQVQRQRILNEL